MQKVIGSFQEIRLSDGLQKSISKMGYEHPTPIQAETIPWGLLNRDLVAYAHAGTGKTAAFCITIVSRLEKNPSKSALILVPSSESACQIKNTLDQLTQYMPKIATTILVSEDPIMTQVRQIAKKPRIIIATPKRLSDHLRRGSISLFKTDILVLDQADQMLDMGFSDQLNEILRFLPGQRQTFMFSTTFPNNVQRLATKYLKDPVKGRGATSKTKLTPAL